MNSDLTSNLEATRFLAFRRQGGDPTTLISNVVQGQQAAFTQEVNRVVSALSAQQADFEQRADAVVRQAVALDVLTPEEERVEGFKQQAADLQEVQKRLRQSILDKNEALALQRQQLVESHKALQQASQQISQIPSRYVQVIEAGGRKVTAHISGIQDC